MAIAVVALAILIVGLLVAHERDRASWRRERSELLNRIKPETAQPLDPALPSPPAVELAFDNDADYWKARGAEVKT